MKPTVGRIVHYWPSGDEEAKTNGYDGPLAAVVTRVWNDATVNLLVFRDAAPPVARTSVLLDEQVSRSIVDETPRWSWPERQPEAATGKGR